MNITPENLSTSYGTSVSWHIGETLQYQQSVGDPSGQSTSGAGGPLHPPQYSTQMVQLALKIVFSTNFVHVFALGGFN